MKKTQRKDRNEAVMVKSRPCSGSWSHVGFSLMEMCSALPPAGWDVAALAQSSSSSDVCLISDPELWHPTSWAQGRGSILT